MTLFIFLSSMVVLVQAQTIVVTNDQGLGFGSFSQTGDAGGTVAISNTGTRTATGDVVLISSSYFYSIFTITSTSATPLTVTIDQPTAQLTDGNGNSISLQLGVSEPESPQVSSAETAEVHIGGTLTLGTRAQTPPGTYSGEVLITFTENNQ